MDEELPPSYQIYSLSPGRYSVSFLQNELRQSIMNGRETRYWRKRENAVQAAWEHYRKQEASNGRASQSLQ